MWNWRRSIRGNSSVIFLVQVHDDGSILLPRLGDLQEKHRFCANQDLLEAYGKLEQVSGIQFRDKLEQVSGSKKRAREEKVKDAEGRYDDFETKFQKRVRQSRVHFHARSHDNWQFFYIDLNLKPRFLVIFG